MKVIIAARLSTLHDEGEGMGLDTQDEKSQDYAALKGHEVIETIPETVKGTVPPYKRKKLGPWFSDPEKLSQYDGVLIWDTDRISRGKDTEFAEIEAWCGKNGKAIIVANGDYQYPMRDGNESDYWQWVSAKRAARREWESIRERSMRAQDRIRKSGSLVGSIPWGYVSTGDEYNKRLAVTDVGRSYIPVIFRMAADEGKSLQEIADFLTSEGVKPEGRGSKQKSPRWYARTVRAIIANEAYKGVKNNGAGTVLTVPALVDADLHLRANKAVEGRRTGVRGTVKRPKAMLSSALECPVCGGKMYRISPQNTTKSGVRSALDYYRCRGFAGAKSCGNMVREDDADVAVLGVLNKLDVKVKTRKHIPATSSQVARAELETKLRKLDTSDMQAYLKAAQEIAAEIEALPVDTAERWETVTENYTYAELIQDKDLEEVGAWLRSKDVTCYASKNDAALFTFMASATAALVTGDGSFQFALGAENGVYVAVRYRLS